MVRIGALAVNGNLRERVDRPRAQVSGPSGRPVPTAREQPGR
jgi:hypothetical protein